MTQSHQTRPIRLHSTQKLQDESGRPKCGYHGDGQPFREGSNGVLPSTATTSAARATLCICLKCVLVPPSSHNAAPRVHETRSRVWDTSRRNWDHQTVSGGQGLRLRGNTRTPHKVPSLACLRSVAPIYIRVCSVQFSDDCRLEYERRSCDRRLDFDVPRETRLAMSPGQDPFVRLVSRALCWLRRT